VALAARLDTPTGSTREFVLPSVGNLEDFPADSFPGPTLMQASARFSNASSTVDRRVEICV
jgi:hypothetical protein